MEVIEIIKCIFIAISLCVIYGIFLLVSGMCKVAKHEDELIEKEMKNKMERKENGKSN